MASKFLSASVISILITAVCTTTVPQNLTVLYESQSLDSEKFFVEQLKPTIDYYTYTKVLLVPYGMTSVVKIGEGFEFNCSRGPVECEGNKLHACVIQQTPNVVLQVSLTTCMIDGFNEESPKARTERCCKKYGADYSTVLKCADSEQGAKLMSYNGILTRKWDPQFVPMVFLNGIEINHYDLIYRMRGTLKSATSNAPEKPKKTKRRVQIVSQYKEIDTPNSGTHFAPATLHASILMILWGFSLLTLN